MTAHSQFYRKNDKASCWNYF